MKFYYLAPLVIFVLLGCKNENFTDNDHYAYLGGEIINPNNNFIVLSKSKQLIDTIKLDGNNRFTYKVSPLQTGLYAFKHGGETQMVLLEPKDSVLLRLNTIEFDESLVYTGKGSRKNNYLINEFLTNEKEEKKILKYCQLSANEYEKQLDSINNYKLEQLRKFKNRHKPSKLFNKIAKANIEYNYYFSKEIYPFVHYGKNKSNILESLPKDFYAYRKHINYNDSFLKDYFVYNTFLRWSFNNIALQQHYKHAKNGNFKSSDACYNLDRLKLVDSLISSTTTKEDWLHYYTIAYLNKTSNTNDNNAILDFYTGKSTNTARKAMVSSYASALSKLKKGAIFPEVELTDSNNSDTAVASIINSATVISFWSQSYYEHFKESQYKINELRLKYPEIKFVSINIDDNGLDAALTALKQNNFSYNNQYQLKHAEASKKVLAIYPMTKAFIIDKNQRIINGKANIFARHFEEELLALINN